MTVDRPHADPDALRGSQPGGSGRMVALVVLCSILLLRLPLLPRFSSSSTFGSLIPLVPFAVVIAGRLMEPGDGRHRHVRASVASLYLLMLVVSGWRASGAATGYTPHQWRIDALTYAMLAGFGYVVFVRDANKERVRSALVALCFAPSLYVAANVVLRMAGVSSSRPIPPQAGDPAQVLSFFGVHHLRTFFPLSDGVNSFGIVVGLAASTALVLAARSEGRTRRWAIIAAAVDIYAILLADSRGPISAALGATLLVLLLGRRITVIGLRSLGFLVPASPVVIFGALSLLTAPGVTASAQGRTISTGTNRLFIWKPILDMLSHFRAADVFGYGAFGQITSGVARSYVYLFGDVSFTPGAHNFVLQTVLDIGYIGLIVVVLVFVMYIRAFAEASQRGSALGAALLCVMVYFVLVGFTEAAPTIYTPEIFFFFVLALGAGVSMPAFVWEARRPRLDRQTPADTPSGERSA